MDIIRGLQTPAWAVGLVRSIVEAALFAGIGAVILWLSGADLPAELLPWAPAIIVGLRTIEGVIDHVDPARRRGN